MHRTLCVSIRIYGNIQVGRAPWTLDHSFTVFLQELGQM